MLTDAESLLISKQINISEYATLTSTATEDQMEDPGYSADLSLNVVGGNIRHRHEESVSLRKFSLDANDQGHNLSDVSSSQKSFEATFNMPPLSDSKEVLPQNTENEPRSPRISTSIYNNDGREITEQFEPGVYITVVVLSDGVKAFKRVRFSKRRFAEQQAEDWWRQNKNRVFRKYGNRGVDSAPFIQPKTTTSAEEDDVAPSSQI